MNNEKALRMLQAADVLLPQEKGELPAINLNDAFFWGVADAEEIPVEELPRVAELFFRYGKPGLCYWVAVEMRGLDRVEFADVNRHIEFVRREEEIRRQVPESSKRAYYRTTYQIGGDDAVRAIDSADSADSTLRLVHERLDRIEQRLAQLDARLRTHIWQEKST